jgi:hypothetical protein
MLRLELVDHVDMIECDQCGRPFQRVYGSIYDGEQGIGIYSADLHAKQHDRRMLLAVGMRYWDEETQAWAACSCTLEVWPAETEFAWQCLMPWAHPTVIAA